MYATKGIGKRLMAICMVLTLGMACMAFPASAAGNTYYVGVGGNDGNSGTSSAPFQTIAHAVSIVGPGDTIVVKNGTYHESVDLGSLSGSASAYITIKAQNPGGAYIDTTSLGSGYNLEPFRGSPSYVKIDGFELSAGANSAGVQFDYGHHTIVSNNIIHDTGASGIQLNHGDYRIIENNIIYHCAYYMGSAGSGISIWQAYASDSASGFHNMIRNNISYENDNLAGTAQTDGNGIIFDDSRNTQNGSTLGAYTGSTLIENNVTYGNGGRGIEVLLSDNVTVRNNTAYKNSTRNDGSTWRGELYVANSSNVTFANNIAVADSSVNSYNNAILIGKYGSDPMTNVLWRNNLTYDTNNPGSASYHVDTAATEVPTSANGNVLGQNPVFVNAGNANFRLQSTSPAINAGTNVYGLASNDLDGNARVYGSIVDLGAYELQSAPTGGSGGGTIFTTQLPANTYNDGASYELGTKFKANVAGKITKVRIYAGASEGGVHYVRIWNANGTLLAGPYSWTISSGTAGWKEYDMPDLSISANTDYIVSVSTSSDYYYVATNGGFNSPINNGNLITYTGSGLYNTTLGSIPNTAYNNTNYFRDVVFTP